MNRRTIGPEEDAVIRADERAKARAEIAAELTGTHTPEPLTIAAIKQMTPDQILERKAEVDRVVAAWDGSAPPAEGAAA